MRWSFLIPWAASLLVLQSADASSLQARAFRPIPGEREASGTLLAAPSPGKNASTIASRLGTRVVGRVDGLDLLVIKVPPSTSEFSYAKTLMASGDFSYVEPNWKVFPDRVPSDPLFPSQWHHTRIRSRYAWDTIVGSGSGDPPMVIAICDSGVNSSHQDLDCVPGYHSPSHTAGGPTNDIAGHGTAVAGTAAALASDQNGVGVAGVGWNFKVMPVRITDNPGFAYVDDILDGILWAAQNGAKVINVSYGGVSSQSRQDMGALVKNSYGALYVNSAGNDAEDMPFDHPDVIIVGSTAANDTKSSFSNYGTAVDCVAPGESILSTDRTGGYSYWWGTSFSSPMTAGALALIWSFDRTMTPQTVEQYLYTGCFDLGTFGNDNVFGNGRIDIDRSLRSILRYRIQELPPDSQYPQSVALSLNSASQVAGIGGSNLVVPGELYFAHTWQGGTTTPVGTLPDYPYASALNYINAFGHAVGQSYTANYETGVPMYFDGLTKSQLPLYPGPHHYSYANGINRHDEIVGTWYGQPGTHPTGIYWASPTATPALLPGRPDLGLPHGAALRIYDDHSIIGYVKGTPPPDIVYPAYWPSPTTPPTLLPLPNGFTFGVPRDANNLGVIVGGVNGGGNRACVWRSFVPSLLVDPTTATAVGAQAINDFGDIVGIYYLPGDPLLVQNSRACLWRNGIPFDLTAMIDPVTIGTWQLVSPNAISANGQICGWGYHNGERKAFIATPYRPGGQSSHTVNCSVVLNDYVGELSNITLTCELTRLGNGEVIGPLEGHYNPSLRIFEFNADNIRGLFSVRVTGPHWLTRQANEVTLSDFGTENADFVLINGDIDNDNEVAIGDYALMSLAYGSFEGDPTWNANADLNGDLEVGIADYAILSVNYGQIGD